MSNNPTIGVKLKIGAQMPRYGSKEAAGADLAACLEQPAGVEISTGQRMMIPTGVSLSIPEGYEVQIRPRSGLAAKHGITVLNSPGTIDSDYTGEIIVILFNTSGNSFTIHNGDRIAQMVVAPVSRATFEEGSDLKQTERADSGFGSTGVSS